MRGVRIWNLWYGKIGWVTDEHDYGDYCKENRTEPKYQDWFVDIFARRWVSGSVCCICSACVTVEGTWV